jgi:hypothetical protein
LNSLLELAGRTLFGDVFGDVLGLLAGNAPRVDATEPGSIRFSTQLEWDELKLVMIHYATPSGYNFYGRLNLAKQRVVPAVPWCCLWTNLGSIGGNNQPLSPGKTMNLRSGFEIDDPALVIPWGIKEEVLLRIGGAEGRRQVTTGYYTASCKALGGLSVEVGFHFEPRANGLLAEMEIFRKFSKPITESVEEFQKHLEATFGKPILSSPGTERFPHFAWRVPGSRVSMDDLRRIPRE